MSRSAEVHVRLDQSTLSPGDTVTGVVVLEVLHAISVRDILITLEGKEILKWEEVLLWARRNRQKKKVHKHHNLFSFATRCEVHGALTPGETSYPFSLKLPHDAPPSFEYKNLKISEFAQYVQLRTEYTVTARVIRDESFTWSLTGSAALTIQPSAKSLNAFLDSKPASASVSESIYPLELFERGQCHVRIDLQSDVIPVESEINLTAFVDNGSPQKIKRVRVILYEDCVLNKEPGSEKGVRRGSRKIREREMPRKLVKEIVNGKPIALGISTMPIFKVEKLLPSISSHFITSLSYRLAVEISLSWCEPIKLEVPIRLVHKNQVAIPVQTAKLQCLG